MRRSSQAAVEIPPFSAIQHSGGSYSPFHDMDNVVYLAEARALFDSASQVRPLSGTSAGPQLGTAANTYYAYLLTTESHFQGVGISALSIGPGQYLSVESCGRDFQGYVRDICQIMRQEPVLDGYNHPGEIIISETLNKYPEAAASWIIDELKNDQAGSLAADILRLLCRLKPYIAIWRRKVVTAALRSSSEEIRDAGIQAVESWCDPDLVAILAEHIENVPWLAEYADQVLKDLGKK